MTREEIIKDINAEMVEEFEVEESVITPDAPVYQTLELDSLSLVDLVSIVKTKYGAVMTRDEVKSIKTFNDLYDYIETHQK